MRLRAVLPVAVVAIAALGASDPSAAKQRSSSNPGEKRDPYALSQQPGQPMLAVVSIKDQRVTIYDANGPILRSPVSSGRTGYETPVGTYSVLQKEAEHYSNRYDDAAMPHMERITWSGVALHGGALPGYPASHGCVRLPYDFAERLFGMTKLGMRVVISRYDVAPATVTHPLLFKPTALTESGGLFSKTAFAPGSPPQTVNQRAAALQAIVAAKQAEADAAEKKAIPLRAAAKEKAEANSTALKAMKSAERALKSATEDAADAARDLSRAKSPEATQRLQTAKDKADAKVKDAQAKLDAVKAQYQPQIDDYQKAMDAVKAVEAEKAAAATAARAAQRKLWPVSVFVSLKTQKLYVRQGFEQVLETPVLINDPDKPIGTHIFTAVDYADGGQDMRWNVVSIGGRRADDPLEADVSYADDDNYYFYEQPRRRMSRAGKSDQSTPADLAAATGALDRISIPPDVVQKISELVLPGSSLIVSDEEASKETGQQTDFIVLISSEPQGGIKKRPREMNPYYDDYYYGANGYGGFGGYYDPYTRRGRRGGYGGGGGLFGFW
jgi:hypothetical protein